MTVTQRALCLANLIFILHLNFVIVYICSVHVLVSELAQAKCVTGVEKKMRKISCQFIHDLQNMQNFKSFYVY